MTENVELCHLESLRLAFRQRTGRGGINIVGYKLQQIRFVQQIKTKTAEKNQKNNQTNK